MARRQERAFDAGYADSWGGYSKPTVHKKRDRARDNTTAASKRKAAPMQDSKTVTVTATVAGVVRKRAAMTAGLNEEEEEDEEEEEFEQEEAPKSTTRTPAAVVSSRSASATAKVCQGPGDSKKLCNRAAKRRKTGAEQSGGGGGGGGSSSGTVKDFESNGRVREEDDGDDDDDDGGGGGDVKGSRSSKMTLKVSLPDPVHIGKSLAKERVSGSGGGGVVDDGDGGDNDSGGDGSDRSSSTSDDDDENDSGSDGDDSSEGKLKRKRGSCLTSSNNTTTSSNNNSNNSNSSNSRKEKDENKKVVVKKLRLKKPQLPAGVRPIKGDPAVHKLFDAVYSDDYNSFLRQQELKYRPVSYVPRPQTKMQISNRMAVVDWLVEVCVTMKFSELTLFHVVELFDRSLSTFVVETKNLQLLACTCVLISSKFHDVRQVGAKDLSYLTEHSCSAADIIAYEKVVAGRMKFRLHSVTPEHFRPRFVLAAKSNDREANLVSYLLHLALHDYALITSLPSLKAAAALHLARQTMRDVTRDVWDANLTHHTGYSSKQLEKCCRRIRALHGENDLVYLNAVRDEFKLEKHLCVASITPLAETELRFA